MDYDNPYVSDMDPPVRVDVVDAEERFAAFGASPMDPEEQMAMGGGYGDPTAPTVPVPIDPGIGFNPEVVYVGGEPMRAAVDPKEEVFGPKSKVVKCPACGSEGLSKTSKSINPAFALSFVLWIFAFYLGTVVLSFVFGLISAVCGILAGIFFHLPIILILNPKKKLVNHACSSCGFVVGKYNPMGNLISIQRT